MPTISRRRVSGSQPSKPSGGRFRTVSCSDTKDIWSTSGAAGRHSRRFQKTRGFHPKTSGYQSRYPAARRWHGGYRSSGPSPAMYRHPIHRQRRRYGRPNWSRPPAFGRCKRQAPFDRHCSPFNRKGSSGQRQNASLCRKINQHKEAFLFYYGMKNMKKQDSGATDRSLSCFARITSHAMQLFFDHPLTEPIMTPVTKYFCTKG